LLTFAEVLFGFSSNLRRSLALLRSTQLYARPPRFRESYGDRLFGGCGTVLTFADVVHFFLYEFTRLCAGRLSLARIFSGSLDRLFIWH
jgi:hypothetical protein